MADAAWNACHNIGVPECNVHLTEIVVYLSLAPKSNAMERAYIRAARDAQERMAEPVPLNIRNAPTRHSPSKAAWPTGGSPRKEAREPKGSRDIGRLGFLGPLLRHGPALSGTPR